ncbi:MAG: M12 family metallopeptidase [Pseudomonadales bacterium]
MSDQESQPALNAEEQRENYCSLPEVPPRDLAHISDPHRQGMIAKLDRTWMNGTTLSYYFFESPSHWRGNELQRDAVRRAFDIWKSVGIGLNFVEVQRAEEATVRIGFNWGEGSWSYVGRDCIDQVPSVSKRTTNFGWDLTTVHGRNTALHELGHVLGLPHEHQNPKAGIIWDEEAVYRNFAEPPNRWSRRKTKHNILRKISEHAVDGSAWDKNSIMHYAFKAGLISEPVIYRTEPLQPSDGLSDIDKLSIRELYPPLGPTERALIALQSQTLDIKPGEQLDFVIEPVLSRKYTLQTFGDMDSIVVLFEERNGNQEFIAGDDDSGENFNAKIVLRLHRGRKYIAKVRLFHAQSEGAGSIMLI